MYNPMKRSVRPFYSVLLLLAMAGSLTLRALLAQNGFFQLKHQDPPARTPPKNAFNETFLRYAAVDIGEPRLKQEIDDLLEGNFQTRGRQRSFLSAGNRRADIRLRSFRGKLLHLRSPEFNHLWKSFKMCLSDWSRKRRLTHPDVMSGLADEVKLLIDEYTGLGNGLFKSCAVVGNSGILLKSDYGKLIDSHDAVIRLNNARTKGFEGSVGSKTNISFINSNILHLCSRREGCFCHPYGEGVPIVMYVCQPAHFVDYLVCKSSHRAPLIVTDPRFDVLCAKVVKYYSMRRFVEMTGKGVEEWTPAHDAANFHYSSGMQAVMLALGVCKRVSIFGFGKSELARHHYHTNQKRELLLHDYEAEYDFYRDLVAGIGAVPFVSDKFEFPRVVMYH